MISIEFLHCCIFDHHMFNLKRTSCMHLCPLLPLQFIQGPNLDTLSSRELKFACCLMQNSPLVYPLCLSLKFIDLCPMNT